MLSIRSDEHFMRMALQEAKMAYEEGEIPIGAIIVCENQIIAKGHNQTERLNDPTAHAEMIAITAACSYLHSKYLQDCSLYVSIEPCSMCAGALSWAQIPRLIFGAFEPKSGFQRHMPSLLHPKTVVKSGVLAQEAAGLMKSFFQERRKQF